MLVLGFGLLTFISTLLGGAFALRKQDNLHLILGFSAGAVVGVAFFDLFPEAAGLAMPHFGIGTVTTVSAIGFLLFMLIHNSLALPTSESKELEEAEASSAEGILGATSLSIHSFLDGLGIGLAFKVSNSVGMIVAAAVLAHDFSDGINTTSFILRHHGNTKQAIRWLFLDALAPLLGVIATFFFSLSRSSLGLVLALFSGFFIFIGASDLLPESYHRHPKAITSLMVILGAVVIYLAVHLAG
jgi:ZIP family zinc transporter